MAYHCGLTHWPSAKLDAKTSSLPPNLTPRRMRYNSSSVRQPSWKLLFAVSWLALTLKFASVAAASPLKALGHSSQSQDRVSHPQTPPGKPLPSIRALLAAVRKHQQVIDRRVEDYACTQTVEEDGIDGHEQVKSRKIRTYHVIYVAGYEIDTLVAKDGKPLSESQQAQENEHSRKQIEKAEARARRKSSSRDKDIGIATFLRTSLFTHPHWDEYRAHPVVVFDFGPNPSYKPRDLNERLAHSLEGVVWVDPEAQEVVRLQAWLDRSVKLAGGLLARVNQGSALAFEQAPIESQLWMPTYAEAKYSGRVFLFKGLRGKIIIHYGDYRKFHVETVEKIAPVHGETRQ
jgi:hypothetical protein